MSSRRTVSTAAPSPPAWRTAATVAILLHLFCLGLAVVSNVGGGRSRVGYALRKVPLATKYLKFLDMDLAYDFDLAGVEPIHASHVLEVAAPGTEGPLATLPPGDVTSRIRRQRYGELAQQVADFDKAFSENGDLRTLLPLAIADAWLRELDAPHENYVLTCRREPPPRWAAAAEEVSAAMAKVKEGAPTAGPTIADAGEAIDVDLVWNPWSGHYEGSRRAAKALTAKAVAPAAQDAGATPQDDAANEPPAEEPEAEQ